jgi:hypothetical protein
VRVAAELVVILSGGLSIAKFILIDRVMKPRLRRRKVEEIERENRDLDEMLEQIRHERSNG